MRSYQVQTGAAERVTLLGMINNTKVLGQVSTRWEEPGLFASSWANLVGGWCVQHYRKHGEPPHKGLLTYAQEWAESQQDQEVVGAVNTFLSSLEREEYQLNGEVNPGYTLDLAAKHFNHVKINRLKETLESYLDAKQVDKAQREIEAFHRVEMGGGSGVDLFLDYEAVKATLSSERQEPLVTFPGDLGKFFGQRLAREQFIAFMSPEKTGKTWWLMEVAWRAMCQRRKVAFFVTGDDSQEDINERFLVRAAKHPYSSETGWPLVAKWPTRVHAPAKEDESAEVDFEERSIPKALDVKKAWAACEEVMRDRVKSKDSYLRLSVHPNSTVNVLDLKAHLQAWALDGFVPDVIVVDYADILAPPVGKQLETRDQIDLTWRQLRALSQEFHCLLVTATQADAASYEKRTLDRRNFSNDKRKMAHVTGMVGINVTGEEKERQLMRLNWVVRRKGAYSPRRCVHVAGCLALGCPAVRSTF